MSQRAVLAWLIAALVVGAGAVLFLMRKPPASAGPASGVQVKVPFSEVRAIDIAAPAGACRLEPGELGWTLVEGHRRWPVEESHVRAAVRLLNEGVAGASSSPSRTDLEVRITLSSGSLTIRFGPAGAGGHAPAIVIDAAGEHPASAESTLRDIFDLRAIRAWRIPRALPDASLGPARISFASGESALSLARIGKRWSFREPASVAGAAADADAIQQLSAAIASASIIAFEDGMTPDDLGPRRAEIRIERDVPRAQGPSDVVTTELIVGSLADVEGREVYAITTTYRASPGGDAAAIWGPQVIRVPVADLNRLAPTPIAYLSRRALEIPPSDIQSISIARDAVDRDFTRSLRGWEHDGAPVEPLADAHLARVAALLTETRADEVAPEPPAALTPLADLHIGALSLPQGAQATLALAPASPTRAKPALAVRIGGFWRIYTVPQAAELAAWISSLK